MLDELPIGIDLKNLKLTCELCGTEFDADNEDEVDDVDNIDESGACRFCDKNRDLNIN